jgi:glycerol uptake facilitator-like aquaporin
LQKNEWLGTQALVAEFIGTFALINRAVTIRLWVYLVGPSLGAVLAAWLNASLLKLD